MLGFFVQGFLMLFPKYSARLKPTFALTAGFVGYGTTDCILDIGTGPGQLLLAMRKVLLDATLVGVDISSSMVTTRRLSDPYIKIKPIAQCQAIFTFLSKNLVKLFLLLFNFSAE
jgi:trans-aconitate methyltransferase